MLLQRVWKFVHVFQSFDFLASVYFILFSFEMKSSKKKSDWPVLNVKFRPIKFQVHDPDSL